MISNENLSSELTVIQSTKRREYNIESGEHTFLY